MKHNIKKRGYSYSLRPVNINDAQFIIDLRTADPDRNKFIHSTSKEISLQEKWLMDYFLREDDLYFVIENNMTNEPEGLVGIYDIDKVRKTAEWGRWNIKSTSMAAIESVELIFTIAFETLELDELYCRTNANNKKVCAFHDSIEQKSRGIIKDHFIIDGVKFDAMEHFVSKDYFYTYIQEKLTRKSLMIFDRALKQKIGSFEFHHIGIATKDIEKDFNSYKILGYFKDSTEFIDENQGIKGLFINAKGQPRLELLKNLENSSTLDLWLKNKTKMYHLAYIVENFDEAINYFINAGLKIISEPKISTEFKKRISFLMLPNMSIIELIEKT